MSALFSSPSLPPPQALPTVPNAGDAEVRKAADDRLRNQQAQGRAANYLTNPTTNNYTSPVNKQQYLGTIS
jgi:hypothetical protein